MTAQGTYGSMKLQGWNTDLSKRWEYEVAGSSPSARGSHMSPVVDIDNDGSDEILWGERCISLETVRISYLLSNIDRLITYKAIADKAETQVDLKSFLVLRNFSGEDFDKARVLLDYGEAFEQGIDHEETKRMLFLKADKVPIIKIWTFDAAKLPWDSGKLENKNVGISVSYRIVNNTESKLGEFALWGGKARLFQDDGHESTIFLGEDVTGLVPVGEKMELYIGDSRDIVVTQRKMKDTRIITHKNNNGQPVLYDTKELKMQYHRRNVRP